MTALVAALWLATLPGRAEVRYRVELDGQHLGWARLALACAAGGCRLEWQSALRQPVEAGGGLVTRRIEAETDPGGRARRLRVEVVADGREWHTQGRTGAVPALLGELLLVGLTGEGEQRCVAVADEESGRAGSACGRRTGAWVDVETLGEAVRLRASPGELPAEVLVPGQRMRFTADAGAALPAHPPRLFGVEVPAASLGERWCRRSPDREVAAAPGPAPRSFPPGATCRERTAIYLALAAARGLRGRHAVGVAFDGRAMVWHEWAELWTGGRWVPVDPSFEQLPAAGRRFTVARFEEGDLAARAAAGRAVLACWRR